MTDHRPNGQAGGEAHILVVDDYAPNLAAMSALLEPIGREVTTARSGEEALRRLADREFAVVVLDVRMPGLNGLEVARRLRSSNRNATVPIIFLTALDGDTADIVEGYAVGAVDYVRKPFEAVVLRSKIATFVELHERREQMRREEARVAQLEMERATAARESREKDEFLSLVTHELRTPLTSILLWTDMLLHRSLGPDALMRGLLAIDRCARAEAHVVENVLEMSRIATGRFVMTLQPIDLLPIVNTALEEVRSIHERGPSAPSAGDVDKLRILGDRQRLVQTLFNVVDNAVKFTSGPAGGGVAVSISATPADVSIRVADSGPGIPGSVKERLFRPFHPGDSTSTRPHGGLGLGLVVAQAIIRAHAGALAIEDQDGGGRGTIVTVTIPRAA